ncbi:hypothetical protein AVEN_60973-1 [Araneus ventricosus]|uniref:Uncharacterized protein n=1 Tax=Araneus ventricosus TaxID=182803 RepID=A0A4Y2DDJ1_ARAVE|nr:hypothetical protein AVEN_60973-1 [Araneus ventricosus]
MASDISSQSSWGMIEKYFPFQQKDETETWQPNIFYGRNKSVGGAIENPIKRPDDMSLISRNSISELISSVSCDTANLFSSSATKFSALLLLLTVVFHRLTDVTEFAFPPVAPQGPEMTLCFACQSTKHKWLFSEKRT